MAELVISFAGEARSGGYQDKYPFKPCLWARQGQVDILRTWIELNGDAGVIVSQQLRELGVDDPDELIKKAILRYGVGRFEALVREVMTSGGASGMVSPTWTLGRDDRPLLLELATAKTCEYQTRIRRDLFCTIPGVDDTTAVVTIGGKAAAPTSRPVCRSCDLPDTDYVCSHLLHPAIVGLETTDSYGRQVSYALCDLGRPEVRNQANCHLGGHACAERILELQPAAATAQLSALSVAEAFDVLDAHWRLAFGKPKRLLALSTLTGPSALSLGCTTRTDFESRLSALGDVINRLSIDDELLPAGLTAKQKTGSINRLEASLTYKLPADQHAPIGRAIQTLRRIRQARNAAQHGMAEGGLTEQLATLGITDAPPNWPGAWDAIRAATVDALTVIRHELRRWIDSGDT